MSDWIKTPLIGFRLGIGEMGASAIFTDDIKAFINRCIHARALFVHFQHLFESDDGGALIKIAPIFFGDICHALRAYLILQVCKLTDPAGDRRGNENLTVAFLVRNAAIKYQTDVDRLQYLADQLHKFRDAIKPARDKLISHSDLSAIRRGDPLGGVNIEAWYSFWINLQSFVMILSEQYLGEGIPINAVSNQSDVPALVFALRSSERSNQGV